MEKARAHGRTHRLEVKDLDAAALAPARQQGLGGVKGQGRDGARLAGEREDVGPVVDAPDVHEAVLPAGRQQLCGSGG